MDACLTEAKPIAITPTLRWVGFAFVATVAVGVAWRLVRYAAGFPIWGDEAMLLLNILDRDYASLTQHLRFNQVAPLLFLWLEKSALIVLGSSEWSVHLLPFLAGLIGLFIFWRACRATFSPTIAGFAVGILAVSYYPVRHSAEVKPYAFDLLCSIGYVALTLGHLRNPHSWRWLLGLVLMAPVAVFSSYPSAFVGGAVSLVLVPRVWHGSWTQRSLYVMFNAALCGSFAIHYTMVGQAPSGVADAQRSAEFLRAYWKDAFPPDALTDWPLWFVKVFTGNMLAYPIGANKGGSTLTFVLVLLGSIALWRGRSRSLLALFWLPFALNLLAAILHKYPFGDSARITLHLAPFICILVAHGIALVLDQIRMPAWRPRCELAVYLLLFACGAAGVARDVIKPYKTEHDHDMRRLVRDLRLQVRDGEPVFLCHVQDEELLPEFLWYVRTQSWSSDWLAAAPISSSTQSCWLVLCGNEESNSVDVLAHLGPDALAWTIAESGGRCVPPENSKEPPMYCRWVHLVRAAP